MPTPVSHDYSELLHYTTMNGLRGIIESGCMWASNAAWLNDSSEITHFFDVRLSALIEHEARNYAYELAREPEKLERMVREGGVQKIIAKETAVLTSILRRATLEMNQPFVLSLSGPRDEKVRSNGLLSQWRGYGQDGGYAIVFDTVQLEELLKREAESHHYTHVQIGDVYYHGIDDAIQPATPDVAEYDSLVRLGVSRIIRGGTAAETERFYEAVTSLSCLCKHWGFWEEREVRVVVVPASTEIMHAAEKAPPPKEIKAFTRGESRVPYVELFAPTSGSSGSKRLPIKRIIVGPHRNRDAHAQQVQELLLNSGYTAEVVQSEIPYIGR